MKNSIGWGEGGSNIHLMLILFIIIFLEIKKYIFSSDWPRSQEPPLHRNPGSSQPDCCRFLADGLGAGVRGHCHAIKASGQWLSSLPSLLAWGRFWEISHLWGNFIGQTIGILLAIKVQAVLHLILYWLGFNIVFSLNTLQI